MATLVLCLLSGPASAVCMQPVPKACSRYFKSDAVFVATVTAERGYVDQLSYERFDVRVSKVLRGSVPQYTSVFTGNNSGRLLWKKGKTYIVFAERVNGRLESADGCGPFSDPASVPGFLQQIQELKAARDSRIEGEVISRSPDEEGIEGVEVRAVGASGSYTGKSDRKGTFRIQVPPGRYDVIVDPLVAVPSGVNWGEVNKFVLQRGQCMQIQFEAR